MNAIRFKKKKENYVTEKPRLVVPVVVRHAIRLEKDGSVAEYSPWSNGYVRERV